MHGLSLTPVAIFGLLDPPWPISCRHIEAFWFFYGVHHEFFVVCYYIVLFWAFFWSKFCLLSSLPLTQKVLRKLSRMVSSCEQWTDKCGCSIILWCSFSVACCLITSGGRILESTVSRFILVGFRTLDMFLKALLVKYQPMQCRWLNYCTTFRSSCIVSKAISSAYMNFCETSR